MSSTAAARTLPLSELTPTGVFVVYVLDEADEPLSRGAIVRRTGAAERTLRDALADLQERGLVDVARPSDPTTAALYELAA